MPLNLAKNILYFGSPEPLPRTYTLHAGPFTAQLEAGDLRYLKLGATEVLRRIHVAVRDRNWGTVLPQYSNWNLSQQPDSFRVTFDVTNQRGEIDFFWQGEIRGDENGTITYTMDGIARSSFWRNRLGFCVMHPAACTGSAARVEHVDRTVDETRFPTWLVAAQPVLPFSEMCALTHEVSTDVWVQVRFDGEIFEMEDQRNWTDASFKTFSTPLRLPFPVLVEEGTRIRQTVTISLKTTATPFPHAVKAEKQAELEVTLGDRTAPLPEIGLGSASHGEPLTPHELERLKELHLSHLRVDLNLQSADWRAALGRAVRESNALDVPLEIAIFLSDTPENELQALGTALAQERPRVKRWLVYHLTESFSGDAPLREIVTAARAELMPYAPHVPLAAGTNADYIFLARNVPPVDLVGAVCFQINAQVHAVDLASVVETLQAQTYVVESARHAANNLPVIVSPVTLKMRFNPYASAANAPPPPDELPPSVDPRQLSLLGAGWTAGSIKYLAQAGAASVTYYETSGWRGVMETEHGSPLPDKFPSQPGMLFPLFHVFADVGEMRGSKALQATSGAPLVVEALAMQHGKKTRVLLSNMTNDTRTVSVKGISAASVAVKRLNQETAEQAMLEGDAFRRAPGQVHSIRDRLLKLQLLPFETARLEFEAAEEN